jgi:hypothetical protein
MDGNMPNTGASGTAKTLTIDGMNVEITIYGNSGGSEKSGGDHDPGCGGGGACGAGLIPASITATGAQTAGRGGPGLVSSITGFPYTYATGGNGGECYYWMPGSGHCFGDGGNGGMVAQDGSDGKADDQSTQYSDTVNGGNGVGGVVIFRIQQ